MATRKNKDTGTILVLGAIAAGAYLIFSKKAAPAVAAPGAAPATLVTQAGNLLSSLFNLSGATPAGALPSVLPTTAQGQAKVAAQEVVKVQTMPTSQIPVPSVQQPAAAPGQLTASPLDLGLPSYNTSDGSSSPYISSDAALMDESSIAGVDVFALPMPNRTPAWYAKKLDHESIAGYATSWTGRPIDSLSGPIAYGPNGKYVHKQGGSNKAMNPFSEVNGTGLAVLAGCMLCAKTPLAGIGRVEWQKFIIPAGVVIGGYFLLKNTNLFNALTPTTGVTANNQATAATTAAALQQSLTAAKNSGDLQTLTTAQCASLANDIATQGNLSTPNMDQIEQDVIQVNTLTDLLQLLSAFGTRETNTGGDFSLCSWVALGCTAVDMPTFLRLKLDQTHLAAINNYLSAQNINYQF